MFSKHVWFDRTHMAEVYIGDDGIVSGTVVAYEGAVCLINPRPEVLTALYQEARLRRILSVRAVVITDNRIDFTRGLCALVSYSRGLRRRAPLSVVVRKESRISSEFLASCCTRLVDSASFGVEIVTLATGSSHEVGSGTLRFTRFNGGESNPCLAIRTSERLLQYFDESYLGEIPEVKGSKMSRPDVVIRAAALADYPSDVRQRILSVAAPERAAAEFPLDVLQPVVASDPGLLGGSISSATAD